uniref:Uncharacterized protein n=1 Tax=Cucumis sativus TaxID=3659 RepID=A0A0A0L9M0_CUCSA
MLLFEFIKVEAAFFAFPGRWLLAPAPPAPDLPPPLAFETVQLSAAVLLFSSLPPPPFTPNQKTINN